MVLFILIWASTTFTFSYVHPNYFLKHCLTMQCIVKQLFFSLQIPALRKLPFIECKPKSRPILVSKALSHSSKWQVLYMHHIIFSNSAPQAVRRIRSLWFRHLKLPLVFDSNVGNSLHQGIISGHHLPVCKSKHNLYQPAEQLIWT